MSPKFSFFCPSSTPAIIKKKIVRLALGLLSWQHSQAWCHSVRCSARRTQNHSALWHSSCALWMWDHLEWEEMFTQRQSLSIYCKCLLWTSCLFFFSPRKLFPSTLTNVLIHLDQVSSSEACLSVTNWQNILLFHLEKIWQTARFGKQKAKAQIHPFKWHF